MLFVWGFVAGVVCTLAGLFLDISTDSETEPRVRSRGDLSAHRPPLLRILLLLSAVAFVLLLLVAVISALASAGWPI